MSGSDWKLNLDWVAPGLAVGGRFPIEAAEYLAVRLGLHHVVDLRVESYADGRLLREHGITLLHLPTEDLCAIREPLLEQGVRWVSEQLERGHQVYVQCEHGVGRSAMLALCVLVAGGATPLEAMERTKQARWQVAPTPEQLQGFMSWAEAWRARHGLTWAVPDFDELARIAYRHLRSFASAGS
ncbi:MAG TPA: protein phosphatase [Myxococcaceae bacterium]